jgi:hypothetical protein
MSLKLELSLRITFIFAQFFSLMCTQKNQLFWFLIQNSLLEYFSKKSQIRMF